jgi:hypothetical protein
MAGARVTSRKVVWADSTSGGYNLSSIIFLYSEGFKIITSLNKAVGHLDPPLQPPGALDNPHTFQRCQDGRRWQEWQASLGYLSISKVSNFHLFVLYIVLHLLRLWVRLVASGAEPREIENEAMSKPFWHAAPRSCPFINPSVPRSTLLGRFYDFPFFCHRIDPKGSILCSFLFVCQFWRELVLVLRGSTRHKWRTNVSNK